MSNLGFKRFPPKATRARILSMVDGSKVGEAIISLMHEQFGTAGDVATVDGKAICITSQAGDAHSALQILTAYITSSGVILGQAAIHEKTNEIPAFQQMLGALDIKGKTVTADALHCQRETCRKIVSKKGDYLLGLKHNQPSLLQDAALFLSDPINHDLIEIHTSTEKNAGRIGALSTVPKTSQGSPTRLDAPQKNRRGGHRRGHFEAVLAQAGRQGGALSQDKPQRPPAAGQWFNCGARVAFLRSLQLRWGCDRYGDKSIMGAPSSQAPQTPRQLHSVKSERCEEAKVTCF